MRLLKTMLNPTVRKTQQSLFILRSARVVAGVMVMVMVVDQDEVASSQTTAN